MRKVLTYDIDELVPYVNWIYFHFAWGMDGKPNAEKEDLRQEAVAMLTAWQGVYHAKAVFRLMEANSDGDDLVLEGIRLPLLRQQRPSHEGAPCLCLADFVRPLSSGKKDKVGLFCATMGNSVMEIREGDDYKKMMAQTLSDRLAEAAAERMHEEVRHHYWGYAPAERLTMEEIHAGHYQGIGVRLSESGMMVPHASVSGLMIAHPQAHYFELGRIGEDQLRDYARRRGVPVETARRFLQSSLIKR